MIHFALPAFKIIFFVFSFLQFVMCLFMDCVCVCLSCLGFAEIFVSLGLCVLPNLGLQSGGTRSLWTTFSGHLPEFSLSVNFLILLSLLGLSFSSPLTRKLGVEWFLCCALPTKCVSQVAGGQREKSKGDLLYSLGSQTPPVREEVSLLHNRRLLPVSTAPTTVTTPSRNVWRLACNWTEERKRERRHRDRQYRW